MPDLWWTVLLLIVITVTAILALDLILTRRTLSRMRESRDYYRNKYKAQRNQTVRLKRKLSDPETQAIPIITRRQKREDNA